MRSTASGRSAPMRFWSTIAADLLAELGAGARLLADALTDIAYEPAAREAVRAVASRLDPV
jgi:hypothetical protein